MHPFQKIAMWALPLALVACASTTQPRPATSPVSKPALPVGASLSPRSDADLGAAKSPLKIGFVYVGPVGDAGWTYQHDLARKAIVQTYGDKVQTTYVQNVSEFGDGQVFRSLAANGHRLIFATTFGYLKQVEQVAKELPDVKFEHAEGYKLAANVRTYAVRTYESAYLAGMLAGGMTRSNRIGVVASIPIPEVIAAINAYTLGARTVNAKATTKVEWVKSWFAPPLEAAAAERLFKRGVDITFQTTDSSAVLATAQKHGKRGIAWDSDMQSFAPKAQLGAATVNWTPYYLKAVGEALDGTWHTGSTWWGVDHDAVDLSHLSADVPASLVARIDVAKQAIKEGKLAIWHGPLSDNMNRVMIQADEIATDAHVTGMNYLVRGVEGRLP